MEGPLQNVSSAPSGDTMMIRSPQPSIFATSDPLTIEATNMRQTMAEGSMAHSEGNRQIVPLAS